MKKAVLLVILVALTAAALTGCFGMGGSYGQPETTVPPQKEFTSTGDLASAVASAKAGSAADVENLKGLTGYYAPEALPDGAELKYIKVAADAVRVGYAFGPTNDINFDNQLELVWYRNAKADTFLSDRAQGLGTYDTLELGGVTYLRTKPTFQFAITPAPGVTVAADATQATRSGTYCQFLFWAQGDGALLCAVPLNFTDDDIGKYCKAKFVELK